MRICVVFHSCLYGDNGGQYLGKEILVDYLQNLACHAEVTVLSTVVTKKGFFHTKAFDRDNPITIIPLPTNVVAKVHTLSQVISQSDFVFIFMPTYSGVMAGFISYLKKKPFSFYHGTDWQDFTKKALATAPLYRRVLNFWRVWLNHTIDINLARRCRFVVVTGGQLQNKYTQLGCRAFQTRPIINLQCDHVEEAKTGPLHDPIRLLYVGTLMKQKGIQDLIRALGRMHGCLAFRLTLVGDGSERGFIEKEVRRQGLEGEVVFTGFVPNGERLFDFYRQADIFILPSYAEGFPRVAYEAAAFGLPLVLTPVNGVPDLLKDRYDALFIDPGNVIDIAEKLKLICFDHQLRQTIAANASRTVRDVLREPAWRQHLELIRGEFAGK